MWGNRNGWMISAGILVITLGIYAMLIFGGGYSEPTSLTTKPGAMDPMQFPNIPRSLIVSGNAADATAGYKEAVDAYRANPQAYDDFDLKGKLADASKLPGIAAVLKGGQAGTGKVFESDPAAVVKHGGRKFAAVKPIEVPGRCAMRVGNLLVAGKKTDEAKKYFNAVFNLGYSLYNERLTIAEFNIGQEFMRTAAKALADLDKSQAAELGMFYTEGQSFVTGLPFPALFNPSNRNVVDRNSGDVFNLAMHSNERMWRIEAILMLGHFRYFAVRPGDQRGANKVLAQLAADDSLDPAVKAAVKASQNLTEADHNTSAQMR